MQFLPSTSILTTGLAIATLTYGAGNPKEETFHNYTPDAAPQTRSLPADKAAHRSSCVLMASEEITQDLIQKLADVETSQKKLLVTMEQAIKLGQSVETLRDSFVDSTELSKDLMDTMEESNKEFNLISQRGKVAAEAMQQSSSLAAETAALLNETTESINTLSEDILTISQDIHNKLNDSDLLMNDILVKASSGIEYAKESHKIHEATLKTAEAFGHMARSIEAANNQALDTAQKVTQAIDMSTGRMTSINEASIRIFDQLNNTARDLLVNIQEAKRVIDEFNITENTALINKKLELIQEQVQNAEENARYAATAATFSGAVSLGTALFVGYKLSDK